MKHEFMEQETKFYLNNALSIGTITDYRAGIKIETNEKNAKKKEKTKSKTGRFFVRMKRANHFKSYEKGNTQLL